MKRTCQIIALLPVIAGISVMLGWLIKVPLLVQIHKSFVPMQFNTALCFTLLGLAAFFALLERPKVFSVYIASAAAFISLLTLLQYWFGVNFGIDELFADYYITVKSPDPGRMAQSTGICFLLIAASVILYHYKQNTSVAVTSALGLSISLVSLWGYAIGIEFTEGWGQATRMALHTTLCFIFLSTVLLVSAWAQAKIRFYIPKWSPQVTLILGCTFSVIVWLALMLQQTKIVREEVKMSHEVIRKTFEEYLHSRMTAIERMANRWNGLTPDWIEDVDNYLEDFHSLQVIAHVSKNEIAGFYTKGVNKKEVKKNIDYSPNEKNTSYLKSAIIDDTVYLVIYSPLEESNDFLISLLDVKSFLTDFYKKSFLDKQLFYTIEFSGQIITNFDKWSSTYTFDSKITFSGLDFKISTGASENFFSQKTSKLSYIILSLCLILTLSCFFLLRAWEKMAENNQQQESLIGDLSESNTDLERFAYIASHDLQEPLRMVINFNKLLKEEYYDKLEGEGIQYIDISCDAASRMSELINGILTYSRVSQGTNFDKMEVDLNETLESVKINLAQMIEEKQAKITSKKLPTVVTSKIHAIQIFQNIISNGMKYHNKDNIPEIHISCKEDKDFHTIAIKDNGIGIDKKYLDRIFLPFKRLHSNSQFKGSGIGLSICKKTIEKLGGKLTVSSTVGKGTTFYVSYKKIKGEESEKTQ